MRWLLVFSTFLVSSVTLYAEDISAIVSESRKILTVIDVDHVEHEEFRNVMILSEKGSFHSQLVFEEDNFRKALTYLVTVKDRDGKVVAQYDKKDFKKTSVIESISSYENIYRFDLDCGLKTYPYSIEYHSVIRSDLFFGKGCNLSEDEGTQLVKSSFEIIYPEDYKFRYELYRPDLVLLDSVTQEKNKILKFSLNENFAGSAEPCMPYDDRPIVIIVPEIFKYGNVEGTFNSWKEYGKWMNALWEGRSELSKSSVQAIDELITTYSDQNELARAIYKYTQQNMRYVYIGFELGGFQTMSAKETAKFGYGDCKALSNFTAAAMNYAGIEAYPALVGSGSRYYRIDPDKPKPSFDHVILCLPANGDTTWLECTSNTAPFGYISEFTDDRYALILKPSGGVLAKTTSYPAAVNETVRKTIVSLDGDGSAGISISCKYRNLAMGETGFYRRELYGYKPLNTVKREVNLPSFDLEFFNSDLYNNQEPILEVDCFLQARNVGRRVGNKLLLRPFLIRTYIPVLESDSVRTYPVYFKHGFTFQDTISIVFPPEISILEPLRTIDEENQFGQISLHTHWNEMKRELQISRTIRLNSGEFDPQVYTELISFLNEVRASEDFFLILE